MSWLKKHAASLRVAGVIVLAGLGASACATQDYVDKRIAAVTGRIDTTDSRVSAAQSRADSAASAAASANTAAQSASSAAASANSAAQKAATDAQSANQRIDALTGRMDALEKPATSRRTPRG